MNEDPDYEFLYRMARLRLGYMVSTLDTSNTNSRKDLAETRSLVEEIIDGVKSSEGKQFLKFCNANSEDIKSWLDRVVKIASVIAVRRISG